MASHPLINPVIWWMILNFLFLVIVNKCDRLWKNWAQRGMRRRRKKIDLVLKIVLNKPNAGNG